MQHEAKLYWFDLFRGIASILVFLGHLRSFTFVDYPQNPSLDPLAKAFYFFTGFGHQAVIVFFVLSGFFIIRSIHESVQTGAWNPWIYLFNRLNRLWIVLIPALLFTLFWDTLGLHFFADAEGYSGKIETLPGVDPKNKLSLSTFIGNVFFLQNILVTTYGSNSPLWSLANEFWYYILFPLVYFNLHPSTSVPSRLALAVLIILICLLVQTGILYGFLIWLMGGVVYLIFKGKYIRLPTHYLWGICYSILFFGVLFCIRLNFSPAVFNDYTLGVITAILLGYLSTQQISIRGLQRNTVFLSEISYTVYLFHMPFTAFAAAVFVPVRKLYSVSHLVIYCSMVLCIFLYCCLAYFCFEKHTKQIKKRYSTLLK